jgi:hypothetical protein
MPPVSSEPIESGDLCSLMLVLAVRAHMDNLLIGTCRNIDHVFEEKFSNKSFLSK